MRAHRQTGCHSPRDPAAVLQRRLAPPGHNKQWFRFRFRLRQLRAVQYLTLCAACVKEPEPRSQHASHRCRMCRHMRAISSAAVSQQACATVTTASQKVGCAAEPQRAGRYMKNTLSQLSMLDTEKFVNNVASTGMRGWHVPSGQQAKSTPYQVITHPTAHPCSTHDSEECCLPEYQADKRRGHRHTAEAASGLSLRAAPAAFAAAQPSERLWRRLDPPCPSRPAAAPRRGCRQLCAQPKALRRLGLQQKSLL